MEKFTRESLLGDVLANAEAVQVIEQHMPGITKNPAIKMVKKFTLEKLSHYPQAGLPSETLDTLLAEINARLED